MVKDLVTMYKGLAYAETRLQQTRERWLEAQENDPYNADILESKLDAIKEKILSKYSKFFDITISDDYELVWQ